MSTNTTSESLAQMARELQYPPLNGGPTQDDIIRALRVASEIIEEYEIKEDDSDEKDDRIEELESTVEDAADKLDDVIIDLTLAQASGELRECKALEAIQDTIMEVRSNLRRAWYD